MLGSHGCFATASARALSFKVLVLGHPLLQLDDLERIGRSDECLAEKRIGIERNRRHQGIQLIVWNLRSLRLVLSGRCHDRRFGLLRQDCRIGWQKQRHAHTMATGT